MQQPTEQSNEETENCPGCGASAFYPNGGPGAYWCDECEREFWQEAGDWWSCDASGVGERV